MSLQDQAAQELVPGFKGKRYALCNDGLHHLILAVTADGTIDTQCCADVELADGDSPTLCTTCWEIQFGKP